jgi:serine/threonine protein kinase
MGLSTIGKPIHCLFLWNITEARTWIAKCRCCEVQREDYVSNDTISPKLTHYSERFTESQIIEIGYQIAVALEFCHSVNILHQDMKPMNGKTT